MILKIFTLRDQKTDQYMNPMAMQTAGQIIRMLQDELTNNETMVGKHPEDFELFEVGQFDTNTGLIANCPLKTLS